MKLEENIVDSFEYKGKKFNVHQDENLKFYFVYEEKGEKIELPIEEINTFIESSFSHTTIDNNILDMIEKSVKINNFLFNLEDLKSRLKKYTK